MGVKKEAFLGAGVAPAATTACVRSTGREQQTRMRRVA